MVCVTRSEAQTGVLGTCLGALAVPGDLYLMSGELGTGKTRLIRSIATGLGVAEHAFSPSFVIVREYRGRTMLYHMDFYRLESVAEIEDLGIEEYLAAGGVCAIEWAERAAGVLPECALSAELSYVVESPDVRRIRFSATGGRHIDLLHALRSASEGEIEWS
jgi:tRNA threonylcarbamoyladenosine biosynthesis protein TsaE